MTVSDDSQMLKSAFVVFVKGPFKMLNWKEIALVFWLHSPYRKHVVMQASASPRSKLRKYSVLESKVFIVLLVGTDLR